MKDILISDVVCATNGKVSLNNSNTDDYISNITTSSKDVVKGGLFIAIRGGHNFVQEAIDNGAICCLLEKEVDIETDDVTLIYVDDTIEAMISLATFYRELYNIPAIAITGSNGKTSTKDLVASVLSQKYNVLKTEGNYNNEIGVPMTIFNLNDDHEIMVIELGMNHSGEIEKLVDIVKPNVAIITNIGVAHIEHLGSRENILDAKLEIVKGLEQNGILIVNEDNDMLKSVKNNNYQKTKIITYSKNQNSDYVIEKTNSRGIDGTHFEVTSLQKSRKSYEINYGGDFMVYNAVCGIICGEQFDVEYDDIYNGIKNFQLTKGRLEKFTLKCGANVINDAYNASPDSMRGAIDLLVESKLNDSILILGDMFELGDSGIKMHREVGRYLSDNKFTDIIFCGELMKYAYEEFKDKNEGYGIYFEKTSDIIPELQKRNINEITKIFLKASNGMNFKKIAEDLKDSF